MTADASGLRLSDPVTPCGDRRAKLPPYVAALGSATGVLVLVLAAVGALSLCRLAPRQATGLLVLLTVTTLVGGAVFKELRFTLYVIPLLCVFAGVGGALLARAGGGPSMRYARTAAIIALLLLQAIPALYVVLTTAAQIEREATSFRQWVRAELPAGATIGMSAFPPPPEFLPPLFANVVFDVRPLALAAVDADHPARNVHILLRHDPGDGVVVAKDRYALVHEAYGPTLPAWRWILPEASFPLHLWLQIWARLPA